MWEKYITRLWPTEVLLDSQVLKKQSVYFLWNEISESRLNKITSYKSLSCEKCLSSFLVKNDTSKSQTVKIYRYVYYNLVQKGVFILISIPNDRYKTPTRWFTSLFEQSDLAQQLPSVWGVPLLSLYCNRRLFLT